MERPIEGLKACKAASERDLTDRARGLVLQQTVRLFQLELIRPLPETLARGSADGLHGRFAVDAQLSRQTL
jgi:hypothetical protein